jgi:CRP-like cAMP-binding protein
MQPATSCTSVDNHLLAALPRRQRKGFVSACDPVELTFGEVLAEPGERILQIYFPTDSFVSLVMPIDNRTSMEVGMVGNEGMLGISLILGVTVSPMRAVVQGTGRALRIKAAPFLRELDQSLALQRELRRYLYVVIGQLAQSAVCAHFHVVEKRLARWLLMTQDRAHSNAFHITHEFLASMLGVRRVGITKAATSLQNRKLISYSRGDITILDRSGLEAAACSCYAADNDFYSRIMSH